MQNQSFEQSNQQQTQSTMAQPPKVITSKDALYITDMLSWNLLALKKAHFYVTQCTDPQLVTAINECGQMHQRHYEKILSHLDAGQQQLQ